MEWVVQKDGKMTQTVNTKGVLFGMLPSYQQKILANVKTQQKAQKNSKKGK